MSGRELEARSQVPGLVSRCADPWKRRGPCPDPDHQKSPDALAGIKQPHTQAWAAVTRPCSSEETRLQRQIRAPQPVAGDPQQLFRWRLPFDRAATCFEPSLHPTNGKWQPKLPFCIVPSDYLATVSGSASKGGRFARASGLLRRGFQSSSPRS